MSTGNDEDIKIYSKGSLSEVSEFDRLIKSIDFNRSNGNKEKAEQLGAYFARLKPTDAELQIEISERMMTSSVLYQSRVLITFLCGKVVKDKISDAVLSDTIRNSMYECLKENEEGYYNNIADGAAFSFYRLAFKREGDCGTVIGSEFAKLCGSPKDEELAALGETIYLKAVSFAENLIDRCLFKY